MEPSGPVRQFRASRRPFQDWRVQTAPPSPARRRNENPDELAIEVILEAESVNLTAPQVARIFGLSPRSVYRYASRLGARRFGRSVRFDRETVLRVAREGLPDLYRDTRLIPL